MGHSLLILFGMMFSALYGYGIGLIARVWWLARQPCELAEGAHMVDAPSTEKHQSDAA